jgi:pimeloyl-ACP methyl ester carboxylesterase
VVYAQTEFVADTVAVMDACEVERAVIVGISSSGWTSLLMAVLYPERVLGVVAIASGVPELMPLPTHRAVFDFDEVLATDEGWAKDNRHYWLRDWRGFAEFFFGELLCEPHSTKPREDSVAWALETSPETVLAYEDAPQGSSSKEETEQLLRQVRCPVLAIHGDQDRCLPLSWSERIAELTGADLLVVEGAGRTGSGKNRLDRAVGQGRWTAAAACCTCRPRSGSGTRGGTWRSPTSCASCIPACTWTG